MNFDALSGPEGIVEAVLQFGTAIGGTGVGTYLVLGNDTEVLFHAIDVLLYLTDAGMPYRHLFAGAKTG
jgi:hypothetical protein